MAGGVRAVAKEKPFKGDLIWNKELGIYMLPKNR
ncbi:hypothetical protein SRCM100730_02923 [Bacillus velezensis]|nr:hypothetical protein S101413_01990 [Bacillus velezensis]OBR35018.1 hypothetical protein SRCM100731_00390 [Bacillus velezensis]OCB94498.1 hypothetical protein SRCM100730_02923 [Bacillus velezensis]